MRELYQASPQRLQCLLRCLPAPVRAYLYAFPPQPAHQRPIGLLNPLPLPLKGLCPLESAFFSAICAQKQLCLTLQAAAFGLLVTSVNAVSLQCLFAAGPSSQLSEKVTNLGAFECDCEAGLIKPILVALVSVLGFHWVAPGRGGVGVQRLTSSFNSTTNRSLGTKPVALKLN